MNSLFTFHLNQHNFRNFQGKRNPVNDGFETLHTRHLFFGQNYHQNINLQVHLLRLNQKEYK